MPPSLPIGRPIFARLILVLSICPLCLCGESSAAGLDPEVNQPYRLKVVLHIAKHPLLTEVFKNQVRRELRDGLQAAFGNMGSVEVVEQHEQLPAIELRGLGQPLDGLMKKVSEEKTHFVLINFVNGQYEVQARQHDGLTGLVSPVIRRERTTDRYFVARTATLMIDQDLGVVGTLEEQPKTDEVRITLKGSGLGQPMDRWVHDRDVFAVVRISRAGNEWRSEREEWALLQVKDGPDKDGVCTCRFYHRLRNPLRSGSTYRCIKLGTTTAPLRLRLVDKKNHRPLGSSLVVSFSHFGFDSGKKEDRIPDQEGYVSPRALFTNIAFVSVIGGDRPLARIPIEIMDDRTITCDIETDPDAESRGQYQLHLGQWEKLLNESITVTNDLFIDLPALVKQKEYAKALGVARKGLVNLQQELQSRSQELNRLRDELKLLNRAEAAPNESRIRALENQGKELEKFIKNMEEVVQQEKDPRRQELQAKVEQARQSEQAAQYDEAIAAYREAVKLAEATNEPKLLEHAKERLKTLQDDLQPKNPDHAQAQNFIKNDWPKRETEQQIKSGIGEARRMFEICKKNQDKLTPRRLNRVNLNHATRLGKLQEALDPKRDHDRLKDLATVVDDLKSLTDDVLAYLEPAKAKADEEDPDKD